MSRREGRTPAYHLGTGTVEWDTAADGHRPPTEAEWEHASRAGTTGPRYGPLDEIAWYHGNSDERVHPTFRIDDVRVRVARPSP